MNLIWYPGSKNVGQIFILGFRKRRKSLFNGGLVFGGLEFYGLLVFCFALLGFRFAAIR